MKEKTVLLTGTIDSGVYSNVGNKICNIEDRLSMYMNSVENYIKESAFDQIVFAENSQYEFPASDFYRMAERYNKKFEYVKCPSYVEDVLKHGKSYGEARLIDDALRNSELLKNCLTIYKITGRIFLKNSKKICKTIDKHKNEFIVYMCKKWCFTNIFKFNKQDYLKYWEKIWEKCDERTGKDIEKVFFEVIDKNRNLDVGCFSVYPYFDGIQGATLTPYSGNFIERRLRNVLCGLKVFTYGTLTSKVLKIKD